MSLIYTTAGAGISIATILAACVGSGGIRSSELPYATPESQGVCSRGILDWIDACERELRYVHGFVLIRHGKVVAEGSWFPYDTLNVPHRLYSHSKSFTATAIGFLVDDGILDLDERVVDIFPDKVPGRPSENLSQLRIRDLLTMNAGAAEPDGENRDANGDWERAYLGGSFTNRPGTVFGYDSGATYMLSATVGRKSGFHLMEFLKRRLFDEIGIEKAWSTSSPSGTPCGGWGMSMTTRELARFGLLYLNHGMWEGRRILSSEWVDMASARQTWSGPIGITREDGDDWHYGYGFQFWRCRFGFYRADGAGGQFTIIMPQYDAVLSIHAGLDDTQKELDLVWRYIVPAFKPVALVEDAVAHEALAKRIDELAIVPLGCRGKGRGVGNAIDRFVRFEPNSRGIRSIRIIGDEKGVSCELETSAGMSRFPVGCGEWKSGAVRIDATAHEPLGAIAGDRASPVAASYDEDGGTVRLHVLFTAGPHRMELAIRRHAGEPDFAEGELTDIGGCQLRGRCL